MQQVLIIHGGNTFDSKKEFHDYLKNTQIDKERLLIKPDWKQTIATELGANYEVLQPRMPNGTDADYNEWKMYFEAVAKVLDNQVILIGHSLGGVFLAKYLSENNASFTIKSLILLAAPFKDTEQESIGNFKLKNDFTKLTNQVSDIHFLHSQDDPVVAVEDAQLYKKHLPNAHLTLLDNKAHLNTETFPELIETIQKLK